MQNIETNIYIIWLGNIEEKVPLRKLQKCVWERELRFALVMVHNSKPINICMHMGFFISVAHRR